MFVLVRGGDLSKKKPYTRDPLRPALVVQIETCTCDFKPKNRLVRSGFCPPLVIANRLPLIYIYIYIEKNIYIYIENLFIFGSLDL
jgi:hypothetical protein